MNPYQDAAILFASIMFPIMGVFIWLIIKEPMPEFVAPSIYMPSDAAGLAKWLPAEKETDNFWDNNRDVLRPGGMIRYIAPGYLFMSKKSGKIVEVHREVLHSYVNKKQYTFIGAI